MEVSTEPQSSISCVQALVEIKIHSALRMPTSEASASGGQDSESSMPIPLLVLFYAYSSAITPTSRAEAMMGSLGFKMCLSAFPSKRFGKGLTWRRHPTQVPDISNNTSLGPEASSRLWLRHQPGWGMDGSVPTGPLEPLGSPREG